MLLGQGEIKAEIKWYRVCICDPSKCSEFEQDIHKGERFLWDRELNDKFSTRIIPGESPCPPVNSNGVHKWVWAKELHLIFPMHTIETDETWFKDPGIIW